MDIARLQGKLKGEVVIPGDPGYDEARRVWNGAVDKRPAMVVYCAHTGDVVDYRTGIRESALRLRAWTT